MKTIEGKLIAEGIKFAIVVSRFNSFITDRLLEGAIDCILRHGGNEKDITIIKVPGAFELPFALEKLLETKKYDGICCVGAVIRGATPHFDYISAEATKGIASATMAHGIPVSNGVLTTNSIEQAIERAGSKVGNKGGEAMLTIIEMLDLYAQMDK